jgi:UDP-3-O-[3-hydroxymyristoyl] glucosamine N-acyltransferase
MARSGVTKDVPPRGMYSGFPAKPHREQLRRDALPETVKRLKQRVEALEGRDEPKPSL